MIKYNHLTNGNIFFFTDTVQLVQQVDFLETILEETSDDLQSDSDRSGTTYWLGSDSETESVIHIRAKQRSAGKKFYLLTRVCISVIFIVTFDWSYGTECTSKTSL